MAAVCILIFGAVSIVQQRMSVRDLIARQNLPVRWGIYIAAVVAVVILGVYGAGYDASAFVYMAY